MDPAPLIAAQNTARNALTSEGHEQAAAEYSAASDGVQDTEALRILALLESHHHQLARIIKTQSTVSATTEPVAGNRDTSVAEHVGAVSAATPPESSPAEQTLKPRATTTPIAQRRPIRDVSSSIASDLATARGIPGHQPWQSRPLSPSSALRRAEGRSSVKDERGNKTKQPPLDSKRQSKLPSDANPLINTGQDYPALPTTNSTQPSDQPHAATAGDAFNKFYSTFEGLLSKLSAPLAFAGLPLTPGEQQPPQLQPQLQQDQPRNPPQSSRANLSHGTPDSPDVTRLFSKAALRAVKDDNPGLSSMQESYMVVPTAGGTVSYAGILTKHEADSHANPLSGQPDRPDGQPDHFVDAAEAPSSPLLRAKSKQSKTQPGSTKKSIEELEAENKSLKQLVDNLSRRLYMWEKSSQTQSRALQQSIRTLQMPSQILPEGAAPPPNLAEDARLKDLELQLAAAKKETQRYERENEKLKTVVTRYRERWEKLKEGARVRREGVEKGAGGDNSPAAVDDTL